MVGRRRASIVFPLPGGPTIRRLCDPAAATSSARLACACPFTSEIDLLPRAFGEETREIDVGDGKLELPVEEVRQLGETARAQHLEAGHDPRLREILLRQDEGLRARGACGQRHGERAAHRSNGALEAQLPEHDDLPQPLDTDLLGGGKNPHRDRQIERRTLLAHICRREVYGDALQREGVTGVGDRRIDALAALLHRAVRESDGSESGEAVGDVGLDVNQVGVNTEYRRRANAGEHPKGCARTPKIMVSKCCRSLRTYAVRRLPLAPHEQVPQLDLPAARHLLEPELERSYRAALATHTRVAVRIALIVASPSRRTVIAVIRTPPCLARRQAR